MDSTPRRAAVTAAGFGVKGPRGWAFRNIDITAPSSIPLSRSASICRNVPCCRAGSAVRCGTCCSRGSAGGTYPVQAGPGFFAAIHPYLPMSYLVEGLCAGS